MVVGLLRDGHDGWFIPLEREVGGGGFLIRYPFGREGG